MVNDKLKEFAGHLLIWGWIPFFLISEMVSISSLYTVIWFVCGLTFSFYISYFEPRINSKKFENLKKDLFDRDVDYVFYKLKIDNKETSNFNSKKLIGVKEKYKKFLENIVENRSDKDAALKIKQFQKKNNLNSADLKDLSAIIGLEAIEIVSVEVKKLDFEKIIFDSTLSVGDELVERLSQIIERQIDVYHTLFAIAFARHDSKLRKKFSRDTRGNLAKIIFEKFDSVEKLETLAKSFAKEYPNYNRYNL